MLQIPLQCCQLQSRVQRPVFSPAHLRILVLQTLNQLICWQNELFLGQLGCSQFIAMLKGMPADLTTNSPQERKPVPLPAWMSKNWQRYEWEEYQKLKGCVTWSWICCDRTSYLCRWHLLNKQELRWKSYTLTSSTKQGGPCTCFKGKGSLVFWHGNLQADSGPSIVRHLFAPKRNLVQSGLYYKHINIFEGVLIYIISHICVHLCVPSKKNVGTEIIGWDNVNMSV